VALGRYGAGGGLRDIILGSSKGLYEYACRQRSSRHLSAHTVAVQVKREVEGHTFDLMLPDLTSSQLAVWPTSRGCRVSSDVEQEYRRGLFADVKE
jgi:hypothetical protein